MVNLTDNFGWDIQQHPVSFVKEGEVITDNNFKVLSRSDNNQVLSVMSQKYCPMKTEEFENATKRMQEESGMKFMGFQEFNGGATLLSVLKNETPLSVNKYPIEDYLVMGTSFNGEQPFFIGTSTVLIRCQNQFSSIHVMSRTRHTKFSFERRETVLQSLSTYFNQRQQIYANFEKWQDIKVTEEQKLNFVNHVLMIPDLMPGDKELATRTLNRRQELLTDIENESKELGDNIFGLFQGLTKYTTHTLKTRKEAPFGNLIGTANDLNQRGYRYALAMAA